MKFDPASAIQDYQVFGEHGEVNPSITDSSTYTFLDPETMEEHFAHGVEGCFLYSRHWTPMNRYLANALAAMEGTEDAQLTASGMGAITGVLLQCCQSGDEIIASRTIYGGTYAFLKNFAPRYGIKVHFVNTNDLDAVKAAMSDKTRVVYCESMSNPLLEIPDLPALADIAHGNHAKLVVDNTFAPLILSPAKLGADVVVHSLTKFVNGTSDCVAGVVCADSAFIESLTDVNEGALMLLGPTLDPLRASSIMKNLHSLHIRMQKHAENAAFIAGKLADAGVTVRYPGLEAHPQHAWLKANMNPGYGFGGMLALDAGSGDKANQLVKRLQEEKFGYLAVSLGYFRSLFSPSGRSTSSEIPEDEQQEMGLTPGLVRFSIGLDHDIERSWERMAACLKEVGVI